MMTQLRQRMLEELQRRNYSAGTIRLYLQHVAAFAQHFHRPPDQLGAEHIRQYQLYLIQQRSWRGPAITDRLCAAIFLCQDLEAFVPSVGDPFSSEGSAASSDPQSRRSGTNPYRT